MLDALDRDDVVERISSPKVVRNWQVLDAFAGAGGFSCGFEQAGCKIVGAIEFDAWAAETFAINHPSAAVFQRDIASVEDAELANGFCGSPNILLGGPPCQGYSICNRDNGDPRDPRNTLFREFLRLAKIFEPDVVIMENVPNIVRAKTESKILVVDIIKQELSQLGYHVYSSLLEAINFGVPQIRKRFFVVASKKHLSKPFPSPTHEWRGQNESRGLFKDELKSTPTLWDAISDLPVLNAGEGLDVARYSGDPVNGYQRQMRGDAAILHNHIAMKHGPRMVERFGAMEWGTPVSQLPRHLWPRKRNSEEFADVIYDQNNRRMFPHRPCHTLPASFYANFVHPFSHRNFTPREGARIQSFPDNFIFKGKPTVVSHKLLAREGRDAELHLCQYNQIGNAVPPLMAKALAQNLLSQI